MYKQAGQIFIILGKVKHKTKGNSYGGKAFFEDNAQYASNFV